MSESEATPDSSASNESTAADDSAPQAVKKGGKIVAVVILLSLVWYLASDRYTPYTNQARVQAYVIGVAPQVSGNITEVLVANNERVEAGQVLFKVDSSQYEIALAKAQSDYENTLRQVEAGNAGVAAAEANLLAAQANLEKAKKDTDRLERLFKEDPGTISTRRLEVSRANLHQSRAGVTAAEASILQATESMGGTDSEAENTLLKIARTGVNKAELDLEHTTVTAQDRGVITDLRTDIGVFAGAGHAVMTLISLSDIWIQAEFTENNLGHISAGSPVEILFDSIPGKIFNGQIGHIGQGVSASKSPQPGTLPSIDNDRDWLRQAQRFPVIVRFSVEDNPGLRPQLRVGGQASVVAYGDGSWLTKVLGKVYIRAMSIFSYAY